MSVAAPVRNLLLLVQPQHAEAYLRTTGWARIDGVPDRYTLWSRLDDQEREVFLPLNQKFHDYPRRMAEAIHTLEDFEERPAESIVQDLLSAPFDIIRIKAEEDDDITGSIPLSGGVGLVQGAVDLFIAAGCAAHEKRAYYPSRKPKRALELLESSRLGQTERGSFIITIYVPVPAMPDNPPEMFDPGVSEPFARRSTRTLLQAVRAAGGAAEDSEVQGVAQPFRLAVRDGVSANLCEALADIF